MDQDLTITTLGELAANTAKYGYGSRPLFRKNASRHDFGVIRSNRGLTFNSLLRKDEWERLDTRIVQAARNRLRGVNDLMSRGLTLQLGSLGVLISQWNTASEVTQANVTMDGETTGQNDLMDFKLNGRPVPVIFKDFHIPTRYLEAGRLSGTQLDTANAEASARVVAEQMETMLFDGITGFSFNGDPIYGYTTEPNRNTDTATNYGGGDWGTFANIEATVLGMVGAANGDNYFGPYTLYVSNTQYLQALETSTDGSGHNALERLLRLPMIEAVEASDYLTDEAVLVQMTSDVVDWAYSLDISVVEWMAPNGMSSSFKVMSVATPRVKSEYSGKSGIVHATGI